MEEERVTRDETPTLGRAVSDLVREVGTLVRQEFELAKCEMAGKAERAKSGAVRLGIGAALALVGAFAIAIALIQGLTVVLDNWMSRPLAAFVAAAVVGLALGVAGWLLVRSGAERVSPSEWMPRRTVESIKEDARWARKRT